MNAGRIKPFRSPVLPGTMFHVSHSLTKSKKALAGSDPILFARTYLHLTSQGASDSSLYRLAKAADGTLTREEWSDRVKTAAATVASSSSGRAK